MTQKAILTGHTRGLGAAIADDLIARAIPLLAIARTRRTDVPATAHVEQHELDLSDASALDRWLAGRPLERFLEGADSVLLINNAGLLEPIGPLRTQDARAVARAVIVNVSAPLVLASAFVRAAPQARDRRILHVSSGAARHAHAGWSVYCATKAALDHHARAVAADATPALRISSIAPGVIDTDMQAEIRAASIDNFPDRKRFETMKREGTLRRSSDAARQLVEHLLSGAFGQDVVTELRY